MSTAAYGGKGFQERARVSGKRPTGAAWHYLLHLQVGLPRELGSRMLHVLCQTGRDLRSKPSTPIRQC